MGMDSPGHKSMAPLPQRELLGHNSLAPLKSAGSASSCSDALLTADNPVLCILFLKIVQKRHTHITWKAYHMNNFTSCDYTWFTPVSQYSFTNKSEKMNICIWDRWYSMKEPLIYIIRTDLHRVMLSTFTSLLVWDLTRKLSRFHLTISVTFVSELYCVVWSNKNWFC
jgi:hypothetical protein